MHIDLLMDLMNLFTCFPVHRVCGHLGPCVLCVGGLKLRSISLGCCFYVDGLKEGSSTSFGSGSENEGGGGGTVPAKAIYLCQREQVGKWGRRGEEKEPILGLRWGGVTAQGDFFVL